MLDRGARDLVIDAGEVSRSLGSDHIGTEHFLLAALARVNSSAAAVLNDSGLTQERFREQVDVVGPSTEVRSNRFDPSILALLQESVSRQEVVERAIALKATRPLTSEAAKALGAARATSNGTSAQLVAAMLDVPKSFAGRIVDGLGLSPGEIAGSLRGSGGSFGKDDTLA